MEARERADEEEARGAVQDDHRGGPLHAQRRVEIVVSADVDEAHDAERNEEHAAERGAEDEGEKGLVVAPADAGADPGAVVVELLDAVVADGAVRAARWPVEVARGAVLRDDLVAVDDVDRRPPALTSSPLCVGAVRAACKGCAAAAPDYNVMWYVLEEIVQQQQLPRYIAAQRTQVAGWAHVNIYRACCAKIG